MCSRAGKALILALFSVALADCGSKPAVRPKQVEAGALQSEVQDPQVRRHNPVEATAGRNEADEIVMT